MTRFLNGPAAGVTLELERAPLYLRAVRGADGEWDALDGLGDRVRPGDAVTVYRRCDEPTTLHLDYTDRHGRRRGRWLSAAEYVVVPRQPPAEVAASTERWREWCEAERRRNAGLSESDIRMAELAESLEANP